uniref:Uncharacterized protein n=1 Tax=Bursaphelenchus xylophilus TaxID=6326 RepID=A0A1I7SV97_BURXY
MQNAVVEFREKDKKQMDKKPALWRDRKEQRALEPKGMRPRSAMRRLIGLNLGQEGGGKETWPDRSRKGGVRMRNKANTNGLGNGHSRTGPAQNPFCVFHMCESYCSKCPRRRQPIQPPHKRERERERERVRQKVSIQRLHCVQGRDISLAGEICNERNVAGPIVSMK